MNTQVNTQVIINKMSKEFNTAMLRINPATGSVIKPMDANGDDGWFAVHIELYDDDYEISKLIDIHKTAIGVLGEIGAVVVSDDLGSIHIESDYDYTNISFRVTFKVVTWDLYTDYMNLREIQKAKLAEQAKKAAKKRIEMKAKKIEEEKKLLVKLAKKHGIRVLA